MLKTHVLLKGPGNNYELFCFLAPLFWRAVVFLTNQVSKYFCRFHLGPLPHVFTSFELSVGVY